MVFFETFSPMVNWLGNQNYSIDCCDFTSETWINSKVLLLPYFGKETSSVLVGLGGILIPQFVFDELQIDLGK